MTTGKYINVKMNVIAFDCRDVITSSDPEQTGGEEPP